MLGVYINLDRIKSRLFWELTFLASLAVLTFILAARYDLLERFVELSRTHEHLELDEIAAVAFVMTITLGAIWFMRAYELVRANINLKKQNQELKEALAELKLLKGIIPICSGCKKIRDGDGGWLPPEVYVERRTEAKFSHGICPECIDELYPEIAETLKAGDPREA